MSQLRSLNRSPSSVGALAIIAISLGCSTVSKDGARSRSVRGNYCTETFGSEATAHVTQESKYGVAGGEFFCVIENVDSKDKKLQGLSDLLKRRSSVRGKENQKEHDRITNEMKNSIANYLKEKCRQGWVATMQFEPLGWKCESEKFLISKACIEGQPHIETLASGNKTIFCVTTGESK